MVDLSFYKQNVVYCLSNYLKSYEPEELYKALRSAIFFNAKLNLTKSMINAVIKSGIEKAKITKERVLDPQDTDYFIKRAFELGGCPKATLPYLVLAVWTLQSRKEEKAQKQ